MIDVTLTVNGVERSASVEPRRTLADFVREDLCLTGTHLGCEHGVCGACTVLVDGVSARSCLLLAAQANGAEVTTIEGLAHDGELHPLQEAFWERHGLQCGFCTPGIIMNAADLLGSNGDRLTEAEIRRGLEGNLCRCTGYQHIVDAVQEAAVKS